MAELKVPILVDWNDIKDHMAKSDIVEVVRCKDCKYWNAEQRYCEGIGNWFGYVNSWSENGFCYKGEREDNG